jgi:hypothetical protein
MKKLLLFTTILVFGLLASALCLWLIFKSNNHEFQYHVTVEADFTKYLDSKAFFRDEVYYDIISAAEKQAEQTDSDFYDVLREILAERGQGYSHYFETDDKTDVEFADFLKKETREAVRNNIGIILDRLKSYDLSPDYITSDTGYWCTLLFAEQPKFNLNHIVESAGRLTFQLICDAELIQSLLVEIDNTLAGSGSIGYAFEGNLPREKSGKNTPIDLNAFFEKYNEDTASGGQISSSSYPLFSRLRILSGEHTILAPEENVAVIDSLLRITEVQMKLPNEIDFLWSYRSIEISEKSYCRLYCAYE